MFATVLILDRVTVSTVTWMSSFIFRVAWWNATSFSVEGKMPKAAPRIACFFINLEAEMALWTGLLLPIRRTCTHVRRIEHIVCFFVL